MIGTIKISQLPISSPLDGSENLIINQVGVTKLTTVDDVVGLVTYVSSSGVSTVSQGLTGIPDINVTNINASGIVTASGGFVLGISSSGTSIASGPITELNFIGTGNTFAVTGTSVDISIQGGGGGGESYWSSSTLGIHTLSNVGIATTDPIQKLQVGSTGTSVVVVDDNGNLGLGTTNPTSKIHCLGDVNLDDGGTYTTTLQTITATANRTISLPDATGTVALVAGSTQAVQFNSAGALAGDSGLLYNATSGALTVGGKTVTANAPVLNLSQTWNNAGVTFTGLKLNVTNTASAGGSNLLDLQVGGASQARFTSAGALSCADINIAPSSASGYGVAVLTAGGSGLRLRNASGFGFIAAPTLNYGWSSSGDANSYDLILSRDAANTLAQRNGANAQTYRIYNTYTDASNYERTSITRDSSGLVIDAQKAGTGADPTNLLDVKLNGTSALRAASNTGNAVLTFAGSGPYFSGISLDSTRGYGWYFGVSIIKTGYVGVCLATGSLPIFVGTSSTAANRDTGLVREQASLLALTDGATGPSYLKQAPVAVSALPSAATVGAGTRGFVNDANATTFASVVAGGGANVVPVYSDGTDWRIG